MLRSLYIKDYAIIDELEVEFGSGLNIITGETGAGKSILIGALKMILGERASTDTIRTGAKKAVLEGIFDEADIPPIRALLEANEIEVYPHIIMRREIHSSMSRAFINDTPATVGLLREVASNIIDLHGQHEHQSLLRTDTHLELLDSFGSLGSMVDTYGGRYERVKALVAERDELRRRERDLEQQKELYAFQIDEIDAVDPEQDEDERLESERRVLEHAEQLYASTSELYSMLYERDAAVHDQLVVVRNELQDLARIDEAFAEYLDEVKSAQVIVSEVAQFLQDYNAHVEFNPDRLEEIRRRINELERLKRKYGGTLQAVLEHRAEIGETYQLASDFEGAISRLDEQIGKAKQALTETAQRLTQKRREVASRIEEAIVAELAELEMPKSEFEVRFRHEPDPEGWIVPDEDESYAAHPDGMDRVEFFISTNIGESVKPLASTASGGEISRIMLALKTILAKSERLPILVFDEIDVGISGHTARKVGESMYDLAQYHQIIVITHLPQIAALGDHHFTVEKVVEEGRTKTRIARVAEEERAEQVATLISGDEVTDAALENARELMASRADG